MPCGQTIMQTIYDSYVFLLMCLHLYGHVSFIRMNMYLLFICTCTLVRHRNMDMYFGKLDAIWTCALANYLPKFNVFDVMIYNVGDGHGGKRCKSC
jgi:hypothetical protein